MDLTCTNATFRYGRSRSLALHDISFSVGTGITGLLGSNGAGKSTLMSLLATLNKPVSGSVSVAGFDTSVHHNLTEIRRTLGFLPQSFELMNGSSALDNVMYSAWAHGVDLKDIESHANGALASVDLLERSKTQAKKLSGGQRQRLGIACAMAHQPKILILDEPTVGVDPLQRLEVRKTIQELASHATIIMSTHLVEDIARIASRLLILERGELLFDGSCEDFVKSTKTPGQDMAAAIEMTFAELVNKN